MPGINEIQLKKTIGRRSDPLRSIRFKVRIPNTQPIGFMKVSGLSIGDSDVIEYREGDDALHVIKLPGIQKFDNIVMERGVAFDNTLRFWREQVVAAFGGIGYTPDGTNFVSAAFETPPLNLDFRKNIVVEVLHTTGQPVKVYQLYNCWPKSVKYSDLDSQNSEIFIETVEFAVEAIQQNGLPDNFQNLNTAAINTGARQGF